MRTRKPGAPVPLTKKRETVFGFGRRRTARPVLQQDVLSRSVSCVPENRVRPSRSLRRRGRFGTVRFKRTRKPGAPVPLTKKRETAFVFGRQRKRRPVLQQDVLSRNVFRAPENRVRPSRSLRRRGRFWHGTFHAHPKTGGARPAHKEARDFSTTRPAGQQGGTAMKLSTPPFSPFSRPAAKIAEGKRRAMWCRRAQLAGIFRHFPPSLGSLKYSNPFVPSRA